MAKCHMGPSWLMLQVRESKPSVSVRARVRGPGVHTHNKVKVPDMLVFAFRR